MVVLELFGVSPGSLLGLPDALLRGLWTQKLEKTNGFLRFLKMKLVGSLTLPMLFLVNFVLSLADLVPKWSPKSFQNCSKKEPESDQKNELKHGQKMTENGNIIIHTITEESRSDRGAWGVFLRPWGLLKTLLEDALKIAFRTKMAVPKTVPK